MAETVGISNVSGGNASDFDMSKAQPIGGGGNPSTAPSSSPSQPAQQSGSSPAAVAPAATTDFDMSQAKPIGQAPTDSAPSDGPSNDDEGVMSRMAETSGIPAFAGAVAGQIEHTVQAPIDAYHEAVEAANAGDWKAATKAASKVLNAPTSYGIDSNSPIYKALANLVMQPVNAIADSYKEARKAGQGKVEAGISAAATTVNAMPNDEEFSKIGDRISGDVGKGDIAGVLGDVAGGLGTSNGAKSIPVFGPMVNQVGGNLDEDLHAHNYRAAVGDVLGPLLTFGLGKVLGAIGNTGASAPPGGLMSDLAPTSTKIAGIKVPQMSDTVSAQRASALASQKAAQDFVATKVQPAARTALQSNFQRSALSDVDTLRAAQGADHTGITPPKQPLLDLDKVGKFMKDEAQVTYKKLDAAAASDIAEWNELAKKAKELDAAATAKQDFQFANNPSSGAAVKPKPITAAQDSLPPQPLKFTELQDQLRRADSIIRSKNPSIAQVDREAAIKNYPKLKQQMDEFIAKHEESVNPGELDAADRVRAKATRYGWLANKVRTATKGAGAGIDVGETGKDVKISETTLDNLPAQFDNKYGPGAFDKLIGPAGRANYNAVVKALQVPETGGRLLDWINKLPLHIGEVTTSLPANAVVDNLLFNHDFAQTAMRAFEKLHTGRAIAAQAARSASRGAVAGAPVGASATQAAKPQPDNSQTMDAVQKALGTNPRKGKPLTAPIEGTPSTDSSATSPDAVTTGNRAIEDLPPEVRNAVSTVPVQVAKGQTLKTDAAPQGSVASVDQGAGNNTVSINSPKDFADNPTATMGHELTHVWQNNLPPSVQAKIPDDPKDSSAFDISDVDKLRKQGKTLVDIPREKAATIVQKYVEAKPGSDTRKKLQPWVDDMGKTALSSTQPTASDATKLNMKPRPPGLPDSSVAGANGKTPVYVTPAFSGKRVPGMTQMGNTELTNRPNVPNPETGGHSSVWSTSFNEGKGETLIPRVTNGEDGKAPHILSATINPKTHTSEAIDYYHQYGKSLGTFKDVKSANAYAQTLHEDQASGK